MRYLDPPDISNQPSRSNIEHILAYLRELETVPCDALDALEGLLLRAEVAEQRAAKALPTGSRTLPTVRVQLPARWHTGYGRSVTLEAIAITCRQCGRTVVVQHYPGSFRPTSCSEACRESVRRADAAARQRRYRASQHPHQTEARVDGNTER